MSASIPSVWRFSSWSEVLAARSADFARREAIRIEAKKNPVKFEFDFNRARTPAAEAALQADRAIYENFYSWLNENRPRYDDHPYRPAFDECVDFFLSKYRFDISKLSVVATYELKTPPPCVRLELPVIRVEKGALTADAVYSFSWEHRWLVRLNLCANEPALTPFLGESRYRADGIEHLPELEGEQTLLFLETEGDLYAVLTILFGKERRDGVC